MNPVELKQDSLGHILTTLQIAYAQDGLVKESPSSSSVIKYVVAKVPMGHDATCWL